MINLLSVGIICLIFTGYSIWLIGNIRNISLYFLTFIPLLVFFLSIYASYWLYTVNVFLPTAVLLLLVIAATIRFLYVKKVSFIRKPVIKILTYYSQAVKYVSKKITLNTLKDTFLTLASFTLAIGWLALPVIYLIHNTYFAEHCEEVSIEAPAEGDRNDPNFWEFNEEITEASIYDGTTKKEIVREAKYGKKEVCKVNGKVTREKIMEKPIAPKYKETKHVYREPLRRVYTPAPVYQAPAGGGAICNDGWQSGSTGRGTCSGHGGVQYWL